MTQSTPSLALSSSSPLLTGPRENTFPASSTSFRHSSAFGNLLRAASSSSSAAASDFPAPSVASPSTWRLICLRGYPVATCETLAWYLSPSNLVAAELRVPHQTTTYVGYESLRFFVQSAEPLKPKVWTHVAVTLGLPPTSMRLFIDGREVARKELTGRCSLSHGPLPIWLPPLCTEAPDEKEEEDEALPEDEEEGRKRLLRRTTRDRHRRRQNQRWYPSCWHHSNPHHHVGDARVTEEMDACGRSGTKSRSIGMRGKLADFRVYFKELSEEEVAAQVNACDEMFGQELGEFSEDGERRQVLAPCRRPECQGLNSADCDLPDLATGGRALAHPVRVSSAGQGSERVGNRIETAGGSMCRSEGRLGTRGTGNFLAGAGRSGVGEGETCWVGRSDESGLGIRPPVRYDAEGPTARFRMVQVVQGERDLEAGLGTGNDGFGSAHEAGMSALQKNNVECPDGGGHSRTGISSLTWRSRRDWNLWQSSRAPVAVDPALVVWARAPAEGSEGREKTIGKWDTRGNPGKAGEVAARERAEKSTSSSFSDHAQPGASSELKQLAGLTKPSSKSTHARSRPSFCPSGRRDSWHLELPTVRWILNEHTWASIVSCVNGQAGPGADSSQQSRHEGGGTPRGFHSVPPHPASLPHSHWGDSFQRPTQEADTPTDSVTTGSGDSGGNSRSLKQSDAGDLDRVQVFRETFPCVSRQRCANFLGEESSLALAHQRQQEQPGTGKEARAGWGRDAPANPEEKDHPGRHSSSFDDVVLEPALQLCRTWLQLLLSIIHCVGVFAPWSSAFGTMLSNFR